jgi:uncharacterized membrane protein
MVFICRQRVKKRKGGVDMFLYQLGRVLGILIVTFYFMALMNYIVKWVHRRFRGTMQKNPSFYKKYTAFMRFFVKNHRRFGAMALVFVLAHFGVQVTNLYFSPTGAIAAGLMMTQVGLGIYGSKKKSNGKGWLYVHRTIAVLMLLAIGNHIF